VDLTVAEGEFVSIVGPSGCGKSTLLRIVCGLIEPTAGSVEINVRGDSLAATSLVFQDFGIFPWKTVLGNVRFGMQTRGLGKAEATKRARAWLDRLGLGQFADAYPKTLSGGMRQRVAIARALAVEPELLLMDEPFASLDAQLRELLQEELLRLCEEDRRTVLFVTHSLEEALVLSDRVVVMSARPGTVLDVADVPFDRPRQMAVRESADFGRLRLSLWDKLRTQVETQLHTKGPT
jgi:NitT/TauT family transport system ATP-binding protein